MRKRMAAVAVAVLAALSLSACEGGTGGDGGGDDSGPNGVIFIPVQGNPVGIPVFF